MYYILFIHPSVDGWLGHFHFLAIINDATICVCVCARFLFFISLGCTSIPTSRIDESFGSPVSLFLAKLIFPHHHLSLLYPFPPPPSSFVFTFWGPTKLFSMLYVPFGNPTSNAWAFQSLHILANSCYCLSSWLSPSWWVLCASF